MAGRRPRGIPAAVRELCLAFPEVEEFVSHGSPNYRARKGKVFAIWSLNHHGDGHVGLWLNTPAMEQARLLTASKHLYKPAYVGPFGWVAVELNKGVSWKLVRELAHAAYVNSSPPKLVERVPDPPGVAAPNVRMTPAEIDRLRAPRALKAIEMVRKICAELPGVEEGAQFGARAWRVGKKTFVTVSDYGKSLQAQFWVGIERQGPLEMDPRLSIPPYVGKNGWMALDLGKGAINARELREFVIESWRHFAPRRAVAELDARR